MNLESNLSPKHILAQFDGHEESTGDRRMTFRSCITAYHKDKEKLFGNIPISHEINSTKISREDQTYSEYVTSKFHNFAILEESNLSPEHMLTQFDRALRKHRSQKNDLQSLCHSIQQRQRKVIREYPNFPWNQ